MDEQPEVLVRGKCACGRRYRIRHARPGSIVTCPNCRRTIAITDADLRIAAGEECLVPLQPEQAEQLEAILIDDVDLRPAAAGSREGLTGLTEATHDDAALSMAMHGSARFQSTAEPPSAAAEAAARKRGITPSARNAFLADLWASFYFAGKSRNAMTVLAMGLGCSAPLVYVAFVQVFVRSMALSLLLFVLALLISAVVVVSVVQFYWRTLTMTAGGEDDIPVAEPDWGFWDDVLRPVVWVVVITALCALPALAVRRFFPSAGPNAVILQVAAGAAGSLFWPVAVMSVSIGQSIMFVRPDWLLRCMLGIGPVYLVAWLQVMAVAAALIWSVVYSPMPGYWPLPMQLVGMVAGMVLALYLGYVLFRTLGLLYRHFHSRFPWRF